MLIVLWIACTGVSSSRSRLSLSSAGHMSVQLARGFASIAPSSNTLRGAISDGGTTLVGALDSRDSRARLAADTAGAFSLRRNRRARASLIASASPSSVAAALSDATVIAGAAARFCAGFWSCGDTALCLRVVAFLATPGATSPSPPTREPRRARMLGRVAPSEAACALPLALCTILASVG